MKKIINCFLGLIFAVIFTVYNSVTEASGVPKEEVAKATITVVTIVTKDGTGSGIIYDGQKGYILTNHHVIAGRESDLVEVITFDGYTYKAKVLGYDEIFDMAVLGLQNMKKVLPQAKISQEDWTFQDDVVAIGAARGLSATATQGVITHYDLRDVYVSSRHYMGIQVDAAINPGNSGGGLFNSKGELIGINAAIALGANNLGYAIDLNTYKMFIPLLEMGIKIEQVTPEMLGFKYADTVDTTLYGRKKNKVEITEIIRDKTIYGYEDLDGGKYDFTRFYRDARIANDNEVKPVNGAWIVNVNGEDVGRGSAIASEFLMRKVYTFNDFLEVDYVVGNHKDIDFSIADRENINQLLLDKLEEGKVGRVVIYKNLEENGKPNMVKNNIAAILARCKYLGFTDEYGDIVGVDSSYVNDFRHSSK